MDDFVLNLIISIIFRFRPDVRNPQEKLQKGEGIETGTGMYAKVVETACVIMNVGMIRLL